MNIEDIESMKERAIYCKKCLGTENVSCFNCENQVVVEEVIELCGYTQRLHNKVIGNVIN